MKKYRITFTHLLGIVALSVLCTLLATAQSKNPKDRVILLENEGYTCTGVILETNHVLTCAHCIHAIPKKYNGSTVEIEKQDEKKDLMLVRMKTPVFERIPLADCDLSDEVYSFGHPLGERTLFYSKGYVMNVKADSIKTSLLTFPGDSGSPLFSGNRLAGLITGTVGPNREYQPVSVTVPTTTIRSFLGWTN
jgi:V8-like Glu-specific endopeptidase